MRIAFLKQRTLRPGKLNQIVTDVNRQISSDVEESGRFMTLFFCEIDNRNKIVRWVNAGLDKFRHPLEKEDDVTLVVIKVEP